MTRIGLSKKLNGALREYIVLIEPNRYNPLMFIFALLVKAERGVFGFLHK